MSKKNLCTAPDPMRFKEQLDKVKTGKILFPAEGEGRDAVYAAFQGWEVVAFDISNKGREKALNLAREKQVSVHDEVSGVLEVQSDGKFDAMGCVVPISQ